MLINWLSISLVLVTAFVNVEGKHLVEEITYSVIALLNDSQLMGVEIDNAVHILQLDQPSTILYSGKAPIARHSYRYVKINVENHHVTAEEFYRPPEITDTVNEYFNRTWNKKQITPFPQVYEPLPIIRRIPTKLHKEGEIPTIHLIANQQDLDNMHNNYFENTEITASMSYVSLTDSLFYRNVEVSIAGHESRWMPKVSYNIKLKKHKRIYGFKRIKLRSLANDPSYMREQLAYDMIKSLGLPSTEFSYCRVFLNDKEIGLFGLIETFQDPWTALEFGDGDEDYDGGNVYQANGRSSTHHDSDLGYMKNLTAYGDGQYELKAGKKGDFAPLQKLTRFIADAPVEDKNIVDIWNSKINMDTYLRAMVLEVLNAYFDGYLNNAHNFYLFKDPDADNYIYISADLDSTLGFSVSNLDSMITGDYRTFPGMYKQPLMVKVLQIRKFREQFEEMILEVTKRLVNPVATNGRIDDLVDMLEEDVAWDQIVPRLGTLVRDMLRMHNISMENGRIAPEIDIKPMIAQALASYNNEAQPFAALIPDNPGDFDRAVDYAYIVLRGMPFLQAVNGPTGHGIVIGVKEFFWKISRNVLNFYNSTKS
ncbi:hypothetical protein G6F37_010273 [Rhizopus arrhizus]|nr:hypothetical protein G6F38_010325 [Rhizopus arrhizus]KAG1153530.1 hypothetical protein G6F37_010273 [Rhizopus arrhizus]